MAVVHAYRENTLFAYTENESALWCLQNLHGAYNHAVYLTSLFSPHLIMVANISLFFLTVKHNVSSEFTLDNA